MICHTDLKTLADIVERTQKIADLYDRLIAAQEADDALDIMVNGESVSDAVGGFGKLRVISVIKEEIRNTLTARCDVLHARGIDVEGLRRGV